MARIIGTLGLILIAVLVITQVRSLFNARPWFMGQTDEITGYVIERKMTPKFKELELELVYEYTFEEQIYQDSYFPKTTRINVGDSLVVEVSRRRPSRSYVVAYYP